MADPIRKMLPAVRKSWFAATAKKRLPSETTAPAPFLHDPAARRPHDLDDPFFDPKVKARVGNIIVGAVQKVTLPPTGVDREPMSQTQTELAPEYVTPIICECGGKAHLISRTIIKGTGTERRVFDCLSCRELIEMVVET
jgi:hypothetical protein